MTESIIRVKKGELVLGQHGSDTGIFAVNEDGELVLPVGLGPESTVAELLVLLNTHARLYTEDGEMHLVYRSQDGGKRK